MKKTLKAIEAKEEQLIETVERPLHWVQRHWLSVSALCLVVGGAVGAWQYHKYTTHVYTDSCWQELKEVREEASKTPQDLDSRIAALAKLLAKGLPDNIDAAVRLELGYAYRDGKRTEDAQQEFEELAGRASLAGTSIQEVAKAQLVTIEADKKWDQEHRKEFAPVVAGGELNPQVRFFTTKGYFDVELLEDFAPNHAANMIALVESGFYEGNAFHNVSPPDKSGVVQFGRRFNFAADQRGIEEEGPGYRIAAEIHPELHHETGAVGMYRAESYDSAGSQVFINTRDNRLGFDGRFTVFGKVSGGMATVTSLQQDTDRILKAEVIRKRGHAYEVVKLPLD